MTIKQKDPQLDLTSSLTSCLGWKYWNQGMPICTFKSYLILIQTVIGNFHLYLSQTFYDALQIRNYTMVFPKILFKLIPNVGIHVSFGRLYLTNTRSILFDLQQLKEMENLFLCWSFTSFIFSQLLSLILHFSRFSLDFSKTQHIDH